MEKNGDENLNPAKLWPDKALSLASNWPQWAIIPRRWLLDGVWPYHTSSITECLDHPENHKSAQSLIKLYFSFRLANLFNICGRCPNPSARTENLLLFIFSFRFYRWKGQRVENKWPKTDEKTRFCDTLDSLWEMSVEPPPQPENCSRATKQQCNPMNQSDWEKSNKVKKVNNSTAVAGHVLTLNIPL